MPFILPISVPAKHKATIQNFLDKNPHICASKLVVNLLMNYIERFNPELLTEKEIAPLTEPSVEDVKWFLVGEIIKNKRGIGHNVGPSIIAKGMMTSSRIAQDRWKAIWNAPSEFDFYIGEGYLMPCNSLIFEYQKREEQKCHSNEATSTKEQDQTTPPKQMRLDPGPPLKH